MVEPVNKNKIVTLLKERITNSIVNETAISISVETAVMTILDSIYIESEDYELDEQHLYFSKDNLEFTVAFDSTTGIEYDDTEECFKIIHNTTNINLYFYN